MNARTSNALAKMPPCSARSSTRTYRRPGSSCILVLPHVTRTSPEAAPGRRTSWIGCADVRRTTRPDACTGPTREFVGKQSFFVHGLGGKTPADGGRRPLGADTSSAFQSSGVGCGARPCCCVEVAYGWRRRGIGGQRRRGLNRNTTRVGRRRRAARAGRPRIPQASHFRWRSQPPCRWHPAPIIGRAAAVRQ
jgi:hypothetical protein